MLIEDGLGIEVPLPVVSIYSYADAPLLTAAGLFDTFLVAAPPAL